MITKKHLASVTLLTPQIKPDHNNPAATVPDWTVAPQEITLNASWLSQPARLSDQPVRKLVAWRAQIATDDPVTITHRDRIRRDADKTIWLIIDIQPANTSPYTGIKSPTVISLERPIG